MKPIVNEEKFIAFPREMIVGLLGDGADVESVAADLEAAGVTSERLHFLSGAEGLRILDPDGARGTPVQRLKRKLEHFMSEGGVLEQVANALREGKTSLAIFDVKKADAELFRDVCAANGVVDVHYFGRWTID